MPTLRKRCFRRSYGVGLIALDGVAGVTEKLTKSYRPQLSLLRRSYGVGVTALDGVAGVTEKLTKSYRPQLSPIQSLTG